SESPDPFYKLNALAQKFFSSSLKNAPKEVKSYISSRKLNSNAIEKFGISYAPNSWSALNQNLLKAGVSEELLVKSGLAKRNQKGELYDALRGRLIFPVWVDTKRIAGFGGRLIEAAFKDTNLDNMPKYINSPETTAYQKSKILYGFPQASKLIRETKSVYLVEGYMDVISLSQVGVENVLAVCGTAVTPEHIKRLKYSARRVSILFDADDAGKAAAGRLYELFLNSGIDSAAIFLSDGQDPDDIAKQYEAETKTYLENHKKVSLLECLIYSEIKKQGVLSASELGAAAKGVLAEKIGKVLAKIENPIERDEAVKATANSINIDTKNLFLLVDGFRGDEVKTTSTVEIRTENVLPGAIIEAGNLPHSDRSLLLAVIARKEELVDKVLSSSEICDYLHKDSRLFIEGLGEILATDFESDRKKSLIKSFLNGFGKSWIDLWKESYKMAEDPAVDMLKIFQDCQTFASRRKIKDILEKLRSEIKQAVSEEQKNSLREQEVELVKKMQNI
ncbi:MAG: toprim domain-containing protein, partial [Bdellovibrionales bacterium]|nr:toprim domain-containing protein [Bdellovibrionales bacterium]